MADLHSRIVGLATRMADSGSGNQNGVFINYNIGDMATRIAVLHSRVVGLATKMVCLETII